MRNGNVLFLILLAVALFAALSYAVTQSSRSGGNDISAEKADLLAAEIIQYVTLMEQTIMRLRLVNGCKETELSFQTDVWSGYDRTVDQRNECEVFHPEGGGMSFKTMPEDALEEGAGASHLYYNLSQNHCVVDVGTHTDCSPVDGSEIDMTIVADLLSLQVCVAINERLGVENPSGAPPRDAVSFTSNDFDGVFGPGGHVILGDQASELAGKLSACLQDTNGGGEDKYYFYHVLIPR